MSNDEKKQHISEVLSKITTDVIVYGVQDVNHKPHPYMIGSRHVTHASDNHSGALGDVTLKTIRCAHPGCNLSYEEHTSDNVCFLQLTTNVTQENMGKYLQALVKELGEDYLTGFGFIKSEFEID